MDEVIEEASPIRERWRDALGGGFVVVPSVLLHHQAELGLDGEEVVILLNLLSHWWQDDRLPFPHSQTLAIRTGMRRRTVQRRIASLEEKGFLRRVSQVREGDESGRQVVHYDLRPTVDQLQELGVNAATSREARIRLREPSAARPPLGASRHNDEDDDYYGLIT